MDLSSPTEEDIEHFLEIKVRGKEALDAFHSIGQILMDQYPSFLQKEKAGWLERDNITIRSGWLDSFVTAEFEDAGPSLSVLVSRCEEEGQKIIFSVVLAFPIESPELTDKVMEKCNNLTVLTSANFRVDKTIRLDTMYSTAFGNAIAAYASFEEQAVLDGTLEEAMLGFETALQILASYYLDLCETLYQKTLTQEEDEMELSDASLQSAMAYFSSGSEGDSSDTVSTVGMTPAPAFMAPPVKKRRTNIDNHPDRKGALEPIYPKNILFQGPGGCGKRKEAIRTAVGIIENILPEDLEKMEDREILEKYTHYREEGRICYTGAAFSSQEYEDWIEGPCGEGLFASFSNHAAEGNYVFFVEELEADFLNTVMGDVFYLLPEGKREGQAEFETVSLRSSLRPFSIPSNLYFIGTTTTPSCHLTSFEFFHIRHIEPQEVWLTNLVVKGIPVNHLVSTMNKRLAYLLGPDYQIGHLYFLPLKKDKSLHRLGTIMYEKILPLLLHWMSQSYEQELYDADPYKGVRLVFGDFKKAEPAFEMILEETLCAEEIFGGDLEMEDKKVYRIQKSAFFEIESYLQLM